MKRNFGCTQNNLKISARGQRGGYATDIYIQRYGHLLYRGFQYLLSSTYDAVITPLQTWLTNLMTFTYNSLPPFGIWEAVSLLRDSHQCVIEDMDLLIRLFPPDKYNLIRTFRITGNS